MDKKFVITIGRQLGSGGKAVAEMLGQRLGVPVYDKQIINEAAKQSGLLPSIFEQADEKESKVKAMGWNTWGLNSAVYSGYINNDTLFGIQSQTIESLAEQGSCVIVGRCADYVLRNMEGVLSVFITANESDRLARICECRGTSGKEAASCLAQTEKRRAAYYNYYTFKTWGAAESYDLCLNSSLLGVEGCVEIILATLARL